MVQRIVVCLLVALPLSFTGEKRKKDQSDDMHEKGDSFFSQPEEPYPQTCEKDGRCEVRLFRNHVYLYLPFSTYFEFIQIKLANFLMFPFRS